MGSPQKRDAVSTRAVGLLIIAGLACASTSCDRSRREETERTASDLPSRETGAIGPPAPPPEAAAPPPAVTKTEDASEESTEDLASREPIASPSDPRPIPWLVDITAESGVDFVHTTGGSGRFFLPETMGGGVAVFDADGDGRLDLYFTNQNALLPDLTRSETEINRFYRQTAPGTFEDATARSGLGDGSYSLGVAVGDVDGDRDLDLFVTNLGADRLFVNDGAGRFSDVTEESGIGGEGFSTGAAFFDFDRDGDLDLYVARYVDWAPLDLCTPNSAGKDDYCGPLGFAAASDRLFRNEGQGRFEEVSGEAGIADLAAAGLGVVCHDFDDDGWPDVFVANDMYANHLWRNLGDGRFEEVAVAAGAAVNRVGELEAGMGVVAADLTGDGKTDLALTHLGMQTHTLYRRLGAELRFDDVTDTIGVGAPSWEFTGFGLVEFDWELDGDLDLAVANGRISLERPYRRSLLPEPWNEMAEPNQLFIQGAEGFRADSQLGNAFTSPVEISRGLVAADLDGDGDDDLVVTNIEGTPRLLRNDAPRVGDWVEVRLSDSSGVADGLGGRVGLEIAGRVVWREISASTSYLSSRAAVARFAIPKGARFDQLHVIWPIGEREVFGGGDGNTRYVLIRGNGVSSS